VDIDSDNDPEAVFIDVEPRKVERLQVLLRLKDWLGGIQNELDQTWAVLGEVYGRDARMGRLGLSFRRVKSNLGTDSFNEKLPFLPIKAAFQASGPELLRRLVNPLFGNQPEVGIREMLQNAVDAVRERAAYQLPRGKEGSPVAQGPDGQPDVLVSLEKDDNGGCWVVVRDHGIGMTAKTIRDYFLTAGASYRESYEWQQEFQDSKGAAKVIRSGRFGIGSLAAFLIGDDIQVETRHVSQPPEGGIQFTGSLVDGVIELHPSHIDHVGTLIRVRTDEGTAKALTQESGVYWDWYLLDHPRVERRATHFIDTLKSKPRLPPIHGELPPQWHRIIVPAFDDVQWTFCNVSTLTINGIHIGHPSRGYPAKIRWRDHDFVTPFEVPNVSVFDRQGMLDLSLQRYELVEHSYPFASALMEDVIKDYCAFCLVNGPQGPPSTEPGSFPHFFNYPGYSMEYQGLQGISLAGFWTYNAEGYSIPIPWFMYRADVRTTLMIVKLGGWFSFPEVDLKSYEAVFWGARTGLDVCYAISCGFCLGRMPRHLKGLALGGISIAGGRAFLNSSLLPDVIHAMANAGVDLPQLRVSQRGPISAIEWGIASRETKALSSESLQSNVARGTCIIGEWFLGSPPVEDREIPLTRIWLDIMGKAVVPYDMAERRRVFANAFSSLAPYIEKWQALPRPGTPDWQQMFVKFTPLGA
jgi:hypothetical protein